MMLVARLISRYDARLLTLMGLLLAAAGTYIMTGYSLAISPAWVIWPGVLQGLGMGMIFVPLSTIAYQTLPKSATDVAAGLFNLTRTIGSSIGISIVSTVLSCESQINWNQLGSHIQPFNPALHNWLRAYGFDLADPIASQLLAQTLQRQSIMTAFVNVYWLITLSFILLAPLLLLMRIEIRSSTASG